MSKPPIPPNCDDFTNDTWTSPDYSDFVEDSLVSYSRPGHVICFDSNKCDCPEENEKLLADWRHLIAARAEVAWYKQDEMWAEEMLDTMSHEAEKAICRKREEALKNAAAWRAWGNGNG